MWLCNGPFIALVHVSYIVFNKNIMIILYIYFKGALHTFGEEELGLFRLIFCFTPKQTN